LKSTGFKRGDKPPGPLARIHHRAEHPDQIDDPRDSWLFEGTDVQLAADQIGDDVRLEIGEGLDRTALP
jgi:hypothetical protein